MNPIEKRRLEEDRMAEGVEPEREQLEGWDCHAGFAPGQDRNDGHSALRVADGKLETFDPNPISEKEIAEIRERHNEAYRAVRLESERRATHWEKLHDGRTKELLMLQQELSAVRFQAQKDNIRADLCDTYAKWLLDIGKLIGCGHLDERLPRCVEEEFDKLRDLEVNLRNRLNSIAALTAGGSLSREVVREIHRLAKTIPVFRCDDLGGEDEVGSDDPPGKYIGTAIPLTCANCEEVSTNPGQFMTDGRWVCTNYCRKELCEQQSYSDLVASGGIVDAP